jgi:hypothetical protein
MVGSTADPELSGSCVAAVVPAVATTGGGAAAVDVGEDEDKQVWLVPQTRDVAQQPPPVDAAQELNPDEQAMTVAAGSVVVVVLVEILMPFICQK